MKKVIAVLLVFVLALSLFACSKPPAEEAGGLVFEDATLEKVVREYLGNPKGAIYSSDLEAIDALRILDNSCSFRDDEGDPQSIDIKFEGEPVKSAADLTVFS